MIAGRGLGVGWLAGLAEGERPADAAGREPSDAALCCAAAGVEAVHPDMPDIPAIPATAAAISAAGALTRYRARRTFLFLTLVLTGRGPDSRQRRYPPRIKAR